MREKSQKASREMGVERSNQNECVKLPDVEGSMMSCREGSPEGYTHTLLETSVLARQNILEARFSVWAFPFMSPTLKMF